MLPFTEPLKVTSNPLGLLQTKLPVTLDADRVSIIVRAVSDTVPPQGVCDVEFPDQVPVNEVSPGALVRVLLHAVSAAVTPRTAVPRRTIMENPLLACSCNQAGPSFTPVNYSGCPGLSFNPLARRARSREATVGRIVDAVRA